MKSAVNLYDFREPVKFLEACYQHAKMNWPELTVRKWASMIGMQNSDTLVKILTYKKDLSSALVAEISKHLGLDSSETTYFDFMVKHSLAKDIYEKNIYETVMKELSGPKGSRVVVEDPDFFSHWANMAILSFCNLKATCTRQNLKNFFIDDVSQETIDHSVDKLLELKLIEEKTDGSLSRIYNHEATQNDIPMKSVRGYYRQVFDLGKSRIEFPVEEREFQTSSMAIKKDQLPLFKDLIRSFKAKLSDLSQTNEGDTVYHLNIQFFPMSKPNIEVAAEQSLN